MFVKEVVWLSMWVSEGLRGYFIDIDIGSAEGCRTDRLLEIPEFFTF